MTLVPFSEVNDCTQNGEAKPTVYTDRPRVCMNLRVANVENPDLDDEIETDKQVFIPLCIIQLQNKLYRYFSLMYI
jgi:hypothetical protein